MSLLKVSDNYVASIVGNFLAAATTITVDVAPVKTAGYLTVFDLNGNQIEKIKYTGVSGLDLTSCIRGLSFDNNSDTPVVGLAKDLKNGMAIKMTVTQHYINPLIDFANQYTGKWMGPVANYAALQSSPFNYEIRTVGGATPYVFTAATLIWNESTWGAAAADLAALSLITGANFEVRTTTDTGKVYVYLTSDSSWHELTWGAGVATIDLLPTPPFNGEARVTLDDGKVYTYNLPALTWTPQTPGYTNVYQDQFLGTESTGDDNKTFTLTSGAFSDKKYFQVWLNGVLQKEGVTFDYVATSVNKAVFNAVVDDTDQITLRVQE